MALRLVGYREHCAVRRRVSEFVPVECHRLLPSASDRSGRRRSVLVGHRAVSRSFVTPKHRALRARGRDGIAEDRADGRQKDADSDAHFDSPFLISLVQPAECRPDAGASGDPALSTSFRELTVAARRHGIVNTFEGWRRVSCGVLRRGVGRFWLPKPKTMSAPAAAATRSRITKGRPACRLKKLTWTLRSF